MRGRRKTTGQYETREELEETIIYMYTNTRLRMPQISRICKVSIGTVSSILTAATHHSTPGTELGHECAHHRSVATLP